jgi:hypothetical protein
MIKEAKDLWVAALKSGEFKQTHSRLHDGKGYCALGVLAALAMLNGQCTYSPKKESFDGRWQTLSFNIMKWADIAQFDDEFLEKGAGKVKFMYKGKRTSIGDLNDSGVGFKELADIIEKHWKEL